jgi:flagellar hook-associated protein 2
MSLSTNLISGLSSGFDWRSMIDQLIGIEHRRVDVAEGQKSEYESKLSEWQSFNTQLLSLKTSAEGLKNPEDFYLYTAGMSTDSAAVDAEDLLSVSTDTDAAPGTCTIKVTNLAQSEKLSSNPFTSQTTELGSSYAGDIIINGKVVTINASDSLADVAYSINNANTGTDPCGVTASIINYGTNDYRLILTSDDTGEDGISLLNGSSTDLVQKYGWKDNETAVIKNSITNGAQSDRFTAHNVAVKSLLGLSTGETTTGTLTIGGTAVTIDLSTMSLTDVKTAINDAAIAGVTASVISQTEGGNTYYRLQIDGTQTFVDEKNILNTLGVFDHNSADVTGKVSGKSMTSEGACISSTTLLKDIDAYNTFTSGGNPGGDYITLTGTDTGGSDIGSVNFDISSSTTVQDLLDEIETNYGNVIAYVTSDGKIRVDDLTGGANLTVKLTDHIHDTDSKLEFVDADGFFGAASARKREVITGEDATVEIDGVEVTNSTNVIEDVIGGVTLNLASENDSTNITLKIEHDTSSIKGNIQNFVDKYNSVMSYINTQFDYNEESEEVGGVLFGDGTLRSVKSDLTSLLTKSIWGVDSDFSVLGLVGITMDNDLILSIDDDKLTGYLQTNFNDIMSLFVAQGTVSSSNLSYIDHSRNTESGEYTVHIKRAATRGTETGNVDLASGGAGETLTITQGNKTAAITITNGMTLADIKNEINTELEKEYAETIVGDQLLKEDDNVTYITSETAWDNIYSTTLQNNDVISFSGTGRNGGEISGNYTISNATTDTVQGMLSAIEDAFSGEVTASIDTSGRIVLIDKYAGYSQLSLDISEPADRGLDFGTVDVTSSAGDGSQEGRYAMAITATDDGSNHLVLRNDDYGSTSFTISQDKTDNNYNHIVYTDTSNTTDSTSGAVYISGQAGGSSGTAWDDIYGASVSNGETITISGKNHSGTNISSTDYTINVTNDTVDDLLTTIRTAFGGDTKADVFIRDGRIYLEDKTAGSSLMELTLTYNGSGTLSLGTFGGDNTTERDLDLGLINGSIAGQDVAGTINGESATGSGQALSGDDDNVNTDGLSVRYTGTSDNVDAGTIKLTLGVAELFDRTLFSITDSIDGYVAFKQDSLQDSINSYETRIEQMEARLDSKTEMMINRFVAMELALSKIQSQSDWLAGQISASYSGWM